MVEGIYMHSGDLSPLADIYRLKEKYKCATALEELFSPIFLTGQHQCSVLSC